MLSKLGTAQTIDPDQPMVGKCMTCSTVVRCLMSACRELVDPTIGPIICAGCPRIMKWKVGATGEEVVRCDMCVHMSRVEEQ